MMSTRSRRPLLAIMLAIALVIVDAENGGTQGTDVELDDARIRLLKSYQAYNTKYTNLPPLGVLQALDADRQSVFEAALRALFIRLTSRTGPMNVRPIEKIRAVHAIWGMRSNEKEGRRQFRLSIEADPGLWPLLDQATEFSADDDTGHVLRAKPIAADDDKNFTGFQIVESGVRTYRQKKPYPEIQLSYIIAEPNTGEVDIDFDSWNVFDFKCHNQPSNSDAGSIMPDESHPVRFNIRYNFFASKFNPQWQGKRHCLDTY